MNSMELPLVIFTILSQVAVGLTVISTINQWQTNEGKVAGRPGFDWVFAGILILIALVASLFHLGDPLGSPRTIVNLGTAWLSREILFILLFGGGIVLSYLTIAKNLGAKQAVMAVTAIIGVLLLISSGMVYSPPGLPALNNGLPILYGLLTASILGAGFSSYFASEKQQPRLRNVLMISLVVGLILHLIMPSIWLSGGKASQLTGSAYYSSAWFWLQIIGEFVLGLIVVGVSKKIPSWLPLVLLAGEIIGRISMFMLVVHASSNIGGLN